MNTTQGRSNRQSTVLFVGTDGSSHSDRVFGNGFGAFSNMVDRAVVALTGWRPSETRVQFHSANSMVTFTRRSSGEVRGFMFFGEAA